MAQKIQDELGWKVELEQSSGGAFEVYVGDRLVYSKKRTGRFPVEDDLIRQLREDAAS